MSNALVGMAAITLIVTLAALAAAISAAVYSAKAYNALMDVLPPNVTVHELQSLLSKRVERRRRILSALQIQNESVT